MTHAVAVAAAGAGLLSAAPAAAAHAPVLTRWLHLGSRGAGVRAAQHALHMRASGRFDRSTRRAVLAFQRRHHLLVDGIVGPQTWDALFHIAAPAVGSATGTSAAGVTNSYSSAGGYSIPSSIVQCESGGSYSAVNPTTGAGGAYQILPSTWRAYGGQGLPQDAPASEQNRIAAAIYARQGASAWTC